MPQSHNQLFNVFKHILTDTLVSGPTIAKCYVLGNVNDIPEFVISWKMTENGEDSSCTLGRIRIFRPLNAVSTYMRQPWMYERTPVKQSFSVCWALQITLQ